MVQAEITVVENLQKNIEGIATPNAMCSHKINLSSEKDIDQEVVTWIRSAYVKAG